MTEARALQILNDYVYGPRAFGKRPGDATLRAILAACREQERETLTEAADICSLKATLVIHGAAAPHAYGDGCRDCASAIERRLDEGAP